MCCVPFLYYKGFPTENQLVEMVTGKVGGCQDSRLVLVVNCFMLLVYNKSTLVVLLQQEMIQCPSKVKWKKDIASLITRDSKIFNFNSLQLWAATSFLSINKICSDFYMEYEFGQRCDVKCVAVFFLTLFWINFMVKWKIDQCFLNSWAKSVYGNNKWQFVCISVLHCHWVSVKFLTWLHILTACPVAPPVMWMRCKHYYFTEQCCALCS